jgi:hypothetical protein
LITPEELIFSASQVGPFINAAAPSFLPSRHGQCWASADYFYDYVSLDEQCKKRLSLKDRPATPTAFFLRIIAFHAQDINKKTAPFLARQAFIGTLKC